MSSPTEIKKQRNKEIKEENKQEDKDELIEEIEAEMNFEPNKSILCDWCPYKKICSAWGNGNFNNNLNFNWDVNRIFYW